MTTYTLNFTMDDTGLVNIDGMRVTLAKRVTSSLVNGNAATAWISFLPCETVQVSWQEDYYIYASQTEIEDGATVIMQSDTPAAVVGDQLYTYQPSGVFTNQPETTGGAFVTLNSRNFDQSPNVWTMGLAQAASVNGGKSMLSPLNAMTVPYNIRASFTPIEEVSIWLSRYDNNGVVISQLGSDALTVALTSQSPSANISFNSSNNSFYQT